jgi:HD superfamily phosphohydrolase
MINKRKIINDPVYGFIDIPSALIYDLIEHPFFQRLRRIQQLGLTSYVYPGANHTRFQHALGAMHLMQEAITVLKSKGEEISDDEAEAVLVAILLHDIGHGPFSHALEHSIIPGVSHETISRLFMEELNIQFNGALSLALDIFLNRYTKKFLYQLISSQLDMDRLDYLRRDSFFTGVIEGTVGSDRIIKMLAVKNDQLVIEEKGIYSIEKFLVSRRLMYWQVYLHKTVISAEYLLINVLKRAKSIASEGMEVFATPSLSFFLKPDSDISNHLNSNVREICQKLLQQFSLLEDNDIIASAKVWAGHSDVTLAILSQNLVQRRLYKIEIQNEAINSTRISEIEEKVKEFLNIGDELIKYFVFYGEISNSAYNTNDDRINILLRSGKIIDIMEVSNMLNQSILKDTIKKYFLCYPKAMSL